MMLVLSALSLILPLSCQLYKNFGPSGQLSSHDLITENSRKILTVDSGKLCFAVFGDSRNDTSVFPNLLDEVDSDPEISFAIHLGDMVPCGSKSSYNYFLKQIQEHLHKPLLTVVGNHELSYKGDRLYRKIFGPFYYSLQIGKTHFIMADTSKGKKVDTKQLRWLEEKLSQCRDNERIIVFMHQPLYDPRGGSKSHCLPNKIAGKLIKLFHKYKVTHIFTGHIHGYYQGRWSNIPYTISGGAGPTRSGNPAHLFSHYLKVWISSEGVRTKVIPVSRKTWYERIWTASLKW